MATLVHVTKTTRTRTPVPKRKPGQIVTLEEVRDLQARAMTERYELQPQVMRRLKEARWRLAYHTWNSQHSAKGFLDIMAIWSESVGPVVLLVAELKKEDGQMTLAQIAWYTVWKRIADLVNPRCEGVFRIEVHLWRPSDLLSGAIDAVIFAPAGMQIAGRRNRA